MTHKPELAVLHMDDIHGLAHVCDSPDAEPGITYRRYTLLLMVELDDIVVYRQSSMASFSNVPRHTAVRLVQGSQEWLSFGAQLDWELQSCFVAAFSRGHANPQCA